MLMCLKLPNLSLSKDPRVRATPLSWMMMMIINYHRCKEHQTSIRLHKTYLLASPQEIEVALKELEEIVSPIWNQYLANDQ
jgi:hypothetical protein